MSRILIVLLSLLAMNFWSKANSEESMLIKKFWQTLEKFAKREHLSSKELSDLLFDNAINAPCLVKGSLNVIRDSIYVSLAAEHNTIVINGRKWTGKARAISEVVVLSGNEVLTEPVSFENADLLIVIFAPNRVQFIDYKEKKGGSFHRFE